MQNIDFSVVIPLHNKRDYVLATLRTALSQTLAPLEVLVIDNNSTDGSADLVRTLDNPLIRLISEPEPGPGPARNRGIAEARSPWVAFLDADDLWAPNHLETLAKVIADRPGAPLVAAAYCAVPVDSDAPPSAPRAPSRTIDFYQGDHADLICSSNVAAPREILLEAGGFASFPTGEDTDLWIRLALHGPFAASEALTAYYRRGNHGIMEQQQAALARQAPRPSPVFTTISSLLADPRHTARHAALSAFGDRRRSLFARQLVYNGYPAAARELLRGSHSRDLAWLLWWCASLVPVALTGLLARLWRARHRYRAAATTR